MTHHPRVPTPAPHPRVPTLTSLYTSQIGLCPDVSHYTCNPPNRSNVHYKMEYNLRSMSLNIL